MKPDAMQRICDAVRRLVQDKRWDRAMEEAAKAMHDAPHSAIPHNLMGIVLEKRQDHAAAMKHFRAAWALDPAYRPARLNIEQCGAYANAHKKDFYDESDCPPDAIKRKAAYKRTWRRPRSEKRLRTTKSVVLVVLPGQLPV